MSWNSKKEVIPGRPNRSQSKPIDPPRQPKESAGSIKDAVGGPRARGEHPHRPSSVARWPHPRCGSPATREQPERAVTAVA